MRQPGRLTRQVVLLMYAIFNLLKHALSQAPLCKDFKLYINSSVEGRSNVLVFRDNGVGVSEEVLPRVFEDYFCVERERGSNIGLAYCQRIMKSFGGDIECSSSEGEFTEFRLTFVPVIEEYQDSESIFDQRAS